MNQEEFADVVKRVLELWPSPSFSRDWNEANQQIAFKKLSVFRQDEVLEAFEHHRYDNPDAREPKFGEVVNRLWTTNKERASRKGDVDASYIPSHAALKTWIDGKSDADLVHLWSIVEQRWAARFDAGVAPWSWVRAFREDRRRGPTEAVFCYAAERNIDLTFRQSSGEHDVLMAEYDAVARLAEMRHWRPGQQWSLDEWTWMVRANIVA